MYYLTKSFLFFKILNWKGKIVEKEHILMQEDMTKLRPAKPKHSKKDNENDFKVSPYCYSKGPPCIKEGGLHQNKLQYSQLRLRKEENAQFFFPSIFPPNYRIQLACIGEEGKFH